MSLSAKDAYTIRPSLWADRCWHRAWNLLATAFSGFFAASVLGTGLIGMLASSPLNAQSGGAQHRVPVYTRNYSPNGKGYVHENIADSVAAFRRIGTRNGIAVDVRDDPSVFTEEGLQAYDALVFSNSNNEALATQAQRDAFQQYIHAGHGFLGLHSAAGSERNWPYFQQVLGGHFAFHPQEQRFVVQVSDPAFAAVAGLPARFVWTDECYFLDRLNPDVHPVLTTERNDLVMVDPAQHPETFPDPLPLAWSHQFDNSREFYLALGHHSADYRKPLLLGILDRGLLRSIGLPVSASAATETSGVAR